MNPFTNFLHQWSQNSSLGKFIHYWDRLEHVVVGVYRDKMAIEEARAPGEDTSFAKYPPPVHYESKK
jgi:hypothetical protein